MGDVINRTTLEFRRSVNNPDYPESEWLHNPNMSAVAGVSRQYWKAPADWETTLGPLEMTQSEKDAVDAAIAAAELDALRADSDAAIDENRDFHSLVIRAVAKVVLDEVNLLREQNSLAPRTWEEMTAAVKNKLTSGEGDV